MLQLVDELAVLDRWPAARRGVGATIIWDPGLRGAPGAGQRDDAAPPQQLGEALERGIHEATVLREVGVRSWRWP